MRWVKTMIGAVAAAALMAGCSESTSENTEPAANTHITAIKDRGVIRVCSTGDYRPFTYLDNGNWSGLDIDMADDMAEQLGVRTEFVHTTWADLVDDLDSKCDVAVGGVSITLKRAERVAFSAPYLRDGKAAVVRCTDAQEYRSLGDIDRPGVRVVVNPGGTNADFDKEHLKAAQVIEYPDNNTIFGQILDNKADAMITDTSEIRWQIKQNPKLCAVGVDHPFTFSQKAYAIGLGAPDLQQWIDQWLNIVQHDGTYDTLSKKYFGAVSGP